MPLTRLYFAAAIRPGETLELDPDQANYVGRVMRARPGDVIALFNGDDGEWRAELQSLGKKRATLAVLEKQDSDTESPFRIHLVQGISRGDRMDFVMQKATELGVKRVTPVLTDHGMVKLSAERAAKRQAHWQNIAISASEQCGRIRPPRIDAPMTLNSWFGEGRHVDSTELILVPGAMQPLTSVAPPSPKLCLLIGPEGGFSPREIDDAAVAGFTAVSLGPRILRTETAAVAALSLAQSLWGDLQA